jgi:hypothetical protein
MDMLTGLRLAPIMIWTSVAALTAACGAAAGPSTSVSGGAPETATTVDGDAAVWDLAPNSVIERSSTTFTALVSRLACNSGVTGKVQAPEIQMSESAVVVTFSVAPAEPGGGDCQGNKEVAHEVVLGEPLLDRDLVDGQCLPGGEAVTTSHCVPGPTRYKP